MQKGNAEDKASARLNRQGGQGVLTAREQKRLAKLMKEAGVCQSYGEQTDPHRIAVGFFFYGENAIENAHEICDLLNKLGGKDDA